MTDFFGKMPLDAPLHIRNPRRLYLLNIIYFKIGGNSEWTGRIETIVQIANEFTPLSEPQWTKHQVEYALKELRKSGWISAYRKGRNKPMTYMRSRPEDVLPLSVKESKPTKLRMVAVDPTKEVFLKQKIESPEQDVWKEFQDWSRGKVSDSTYQSIRESKHSSELPGRISQIWLSWQSSRAVCI
ncbi:hypothetical protein [Leptospira idonii]|uniref:Uncharacterized protein n=1 Tax=Leptospira idonii TaxID=1193500 RepID=A0A4R9M227_9LEPT|nr:hypothetical protein [Leptospira idonii]TGN20793.1 hypothetical protein EHS15_01790 [Leptospira idonii]